MKYEIQTSPKLTYNEQDPRNTKFTPFSQSQKFNSGYLKTFFHCFPNIETISHVLVVTDEKSPFHKLTGNRDIVCKGVTDFVRASQTPFLMHPTFCLTRPI